MKIIWKFAILGSTGFGLGGGVAGGLYMDVRHESGLSFLGFIAFGAIGALALGLVLKDWIETILLMFSGVIAILNTFSLGRLIFRPVDFVYDYFEMSAIWCVLGRVIGGSALDLVSTGCGF